MEQKLRFDQYYEDGWKLGVRESTLWTTLEKLSERNRKMLLRFCNLNKKDGPCTYMEKNITKMKEHVTTNVHVSDTENKAIGAIETLHGIFSSQKMTNQ